MSTQKQPTTIKPGVWSWRRNIDKVMYVFSIVDSDLGVRAYDGDFTHGYSVEFDLEQSGVFIEYLDHDPYSKRVKIGRFKPDSLTSDFFVVHDGVGIDI